MKSSTNLFQRIFSLSFSGIIILSSLVMVGIIIPYTSWEWDVDFLLTKQYIIHLDHYRIAFYVHIFSSLFVLVSGAFLFSSYVLKNFTGVHRSFGKLYVSLILIFSAPSGFVMALYANGGALTKLSFLILTPMWWFFTWKGYRSIRNGDVKTHKKWMIRSYALTMSAISLRVCQYALGSVDLIDPEYQYLFVSWVSWVGNLLMAEILIKFSYVKFSDLFDKIPRFHVLKSSIQEFVLGH